MRKLLPGILAPLLLVYGGYRAYGVLSRDYRYQELVQAGDRLLADGRALEATRAYTRAVALKPGEPMGLVKRADAHRQLGNLTRAIEDLEKAGSLSDDVLLVSSRLAELSYESGRFDEAAGHYQRVLALVPDSESAVYQLGLSQFRAGREAEAIEALHRAAQLRSDFWEAYYLRGAIFLAIGGESEAENDFRTALELAPDAELVRRALIELHLEQRRPEKALPLIGEMIEAHPTDAAPHLYLSDANRLAGRTLEAIEAVGRALELDPNMPSAYLRLGELWLEEGSRRGETIAVEKALAALESAVKMDPSSGTAALALGRTYLALGDEERGFSELQRASRATPIQAEALRLLGDLYRARRNPAEAVTAYHVYLKLAGDSPLVLEHLGDAYVESGNPEMGAEVYMKLAALEPRRVTPLVKAARAYLMRGDVAAAAQACRKGLAANPEDPSLLELLSKL